MCTSFVVLYSMHAGTEALEHVFRLKHLTDSDVVYRFKVEAYRASSMLAPTRM